MKAIKRIIASVFVCMFAVTGGLNALALTPTEDSSTVVSQPVSEGISSETSSQTGSVSSGLSSRADDSGLKNESSSSRTPEASSEVDSENSQSSSEPVSSGNNSTSLSASAGMPSAEISSSTEAKQAATTVDVSYKTHVQTYGWQDWAANGASAGTTGLAKRLEAIQIKTSAPASQGGIRYRTHVQTYGWLDWVSDGASSGTTGEAKRLEAIQIELTGALATQYDVYYRVHAQTFGWLDWACNGASAGSAGYAKRLEAIQIVLVPKGGKAPGSTAAPYKELPPAVSYQSYLSGAWQNSVLDNAVSGTVGQAKQIEGIKISLQDKAVSFAGSSIQYRTYLQTYAWQDWTSNGGTSGKPGSGKRVEAVQIKLTGSIASSYDVYYRVHSQTFGWLDWACNGQSAGSAGYAKRIEAIQIVLVKKGGAAPGSTNNAYLKPEVTGPFEISFSPSGASNFGGLVSIEPDHDVILVASAKGGAGGYQYRYRAELIGGSIQTLKDYSGSSSYTWRPNTPGRYKMYVDVKDSTGTVKTAMFQMSVGLSGIDVSEHQGTIDWKKVKAAGIDYAMIRAGFGWEEIDDQTDASLVQNVTGAKQAGLPFGLYHYSYADTVEEAKKEAEFLLDILEANNIAPSDLSYPIAFDIEEPDRLNVSQRRVNTDMVNAFCEIIRDAGYLPMVYASKTVIQDYLYYDEISANNIWMAAWTSTPNDTEIFDNCFPVDMWQYSESGTVDGINGRVDLNICYTTVFRDGSADTTQKGKVVVDAGSSLNVRKAPSVNADVVGSLYKDDIVTIISETSGWYQIVTSTGVSGYVSAEYIQKI